MLQEGDIMKAIIAILLVVIIGFLAYTYFTSISEEEQKVKALEKLFDQAVGDFLRALRTMSGTGLDTTSDVDDAVVKIKKVKKELKSLKSSLQESGAQERAEKLDAKIKEFERKNDIEQY
jgi:flagellin-specific chaperone FliS